MAFPSFFPEDVMIRLPATYYKIVCYVERGDRVGWSAKSWK